jgi:hypothetical protein
VILTISNYVPGHNLIASSVHMWDEEKWLPSKGIFSPETAVCTIFTRFLDIKIYNTSMTSYDSTTGETRCVGCGRWDIDLYDIISKGPECELGPLATNLFKWMLTHFSV